MVWGAISIRGTLSLQFPSSKMNSNEYTNVLQSSLLPFMRTREGASFKFMHDNAPIHGSSTTKKWLQENNIPSINWPPCSPDQNPMENIWGIVSRRVYAENRQFSNISELKRAILTSWRAISDLDCSALILSMPDRIFELIKKNGGNTKY